MTEPEQSPAVPVRTYRPKTLLYSVLAVLWIFPTTGGLFILFPAIRIWEEAGSAMGALAATRLEHWVALLLVLVHPLFVWRAWRWRRTEVPRPVPDVDDGPEKM